MRRELLPWLCLVWLCVATGSATPEDYNDHVSLDADTGDTGVMLGESVAAADFGFFCTPSGQMSPDYAYNDKDCVADGKPQKCGEVWCCAGKSGTQPNHYSCSRLNRASDKNCAGMQKPMCSGPKPTGNSADAVASGKSACQDSHDAICEAAKAYGHCKHSSYASECPSSCGSCSTDGGEAKPSVKSVIAQVEAQQSIKQLKKSDDASEVAKNAAVKMNRKQQDANEAADEVANEEAAVMKAKRKLTETETVAAEAVEKSSSAGKEHVKKVEKEAKKEEKEAESKVKDLKQELRSDNKKEERTKGQLRAAQAAGDGVSVDKGTLLETKNVLQKAEQEKKANIDKLEKDKEMVAQASGHAEQQVANQRQQLNAKQASLNKAKDARAEAENIVSDSVARLNELRSQVREEAPEERQVMVLRNKVEQAEQKVNHAQEAEAVVKEQEGKVEGTLTEQKENVKKDKEEIAVAVAEAHKVAKEETKKLVQKMQLKEEKVEERKLEQKAEMKVEEVAIEQKKEEALKEEEHEETMFTDADLKAKAEAAFLRTEEKIDTLFDNIKPLVLNLKNAPGASQSAGDGGHVVTAAEANQMMQTDQATEGSSNGDKVTRAMMDNMMQAKQMMLSSKRKINKLKSVVDDKSLTVDLPKNLVEQVKEEAKKEADKVADKKGQVEGEKEGKRNEIAMTKAAAKKAEATVEAAEAQEAETEKQASEISTRENETEEKLESRKEDVKDLKEDVQMAAKQMNQDNVPSKDLSASEAAVQAAKRKLRKDDSAVRSARASKKSAKQQLKADKEEAQTEQETAEKKIEMVEKRAEDKVDKSEEKVEEAKVDMNTEKSKEKSALRVKDKVRRLKGAVKEEKKEVQELKKDEERAQSEEKDVRQKAEQKVQAAEAGETAIEEKAVTASKARGAKSIDGAKEMLKEVKQALEKSKKEAEETASAAGGDIKLCKKLVPANAESKDDAALCSIVLEEQHCNFFDYARYCAKSCGTCIL